MQIASLGISIGWGNQVLFLVTVWYLYWFLRAGGANHRESWQVGNSLLSLQFAIVHSWLLHPTSRRRITKYLASEFYGSSLFFRCHVPWATSDVFRLADLVHLGLGSTCDRRDSRDATAETVVLAGFYASWVSLFYSLSLTGLGYQTGWTPFVHWLKRRVPPKRMFSPTGAYTLLRHPVYLSFLGLIWLTPRMTVDHAVLTTIWTVYIMVGSYLKDERLAYYHGTVYRKCQAKVPGYPLVRVGSLGRRPIIENETVIENEVIQPWEIQNLQKQAA